MGQIAYDQYPKGTLSCRLPGFRVRVNECGVWLSESQAVVRMSTELTEVIVNRVLVVEDDADEAEFLKTLLESKGMEVQIARDAGQAHSAFSMSFPDMVLLDLILPKGDTGFEVCERMKQQSNTTPILILSAIELPEARDLASRVGADAYLTKPYDPEELLLLIRDTAESVWEKYHLRGDQLRSERVRFKCPHCGRKLKVSGSHRGQRLNCPQCGANVTVPRCD